MNYLNSMRFLAALGLAVAFFATAPARAQEEPAAEAEAEVTEEGEPSPETAPSAEAEAVETAEPDALDAPSSEATDAAEPAEGIEAIDAAAAAEEATEGAPTPEAEASDDPEPQPASEDPEGEEAAAPSGPQFTFANSFFNWSNGVTLHTFAPAAQLTYDPTWVMNFSVIPRFYLTDTTFLWLNQGMTLELTDSNFGTYNREPLLNDTILDLRQMLRWEGFVFQLQARVAFPLSKASQAAGRILQTGLGLTVARPIPEAAGLTIAGTFGYRRWWSTRNVALTGEPVYSDCLQLDAAPACTQAGSATAGQDILVGGLTTNISPASGLTVSFSAFLLGIQGASIAPAETVINGGTVTTVDDSPTHWRPFTYFSLAVAYDVLPWLNVQLGLQNSGVVANLYNPDGSVRSPFSTDTQVFLSTTVGLDALYGEIVGGDEEDELTPEERQRRRQGLASRRGRSAF